MSTKKIITKSVHIDATIYVGKAGEVIYDDVTKKLHGLDGSTPGGTVLNATGTGGGFSGQYNDLNGKPTFANVAYSADYNDLTNAPVIPPTRTKSLVRAQKTTTDSWSWVFTTLSGSVTAEYVANGTAIVGLNNSYIIFTLTGFTEVPGKILSNRYGSNTNSTPNTLLLSTADNSSCGYVQVGNPNIITSFTPLTHKFYFLASSYTYETTDLYFLFAD